MIDKKNFRLLLKHLSFEEKQDVFTKDFDGDGVYLKVDFKKEEIEYPEITGLIVNERQTCNFSSAENMVVFECVYRLLEKGYKPQHIELEPKWKLGHGASGGRADILVKDQKDKPLIIIECKTYGKEFNKAWKDTLDDGAQLFSYAQQISETEFLCLYASEYNDKENTIQVQQRIISHRDNEKILEQGDSLKSFKKASNVKRRYEVWKDTYQLEYTETGIFESNIQPYQIGKNKYTLEIDTRPVSVKDKEGKYHRFRTILRQHNIARRETAFEVLVNLFLAKIVDEEENKTDLEFYWKGVAYDNYYDFIDRLQKLYQIGMHKFLKDDVMYISNEQIDSAFWTVKNKRNATKKQIQKYFRDLKFFSNNAFTMINVHNERLFNRNTKVLVELVQMWQGLRLKTKEQNQFLGDMFEYFLDNSIKQSEGQFFTPIPITKFIVSSLPLENKIKNSSEPLKAIDYACGSGHFLNEYAHQIKPIIEHYKEADISKYYENIVGIEKEDRLAKIAKVSAYMYGQDQIRIIEEDALSDIDEVKPQSFDVLVANPPFAVEGFLLNLSEKRKLEFDLINTTELNSNTNNIQCFFIERAKQLIAPNGVLGIIVPSSIISNSDATHIGTREIILKYFNIVSIVELGSGTFGKTGTNTVVLFLKRKSQLPEPSEHYANRVNDFFDGFNEKDKSTEEYQDLYLVKKYCEHCELPYEEYIKLFAIEAKDISKLDDLFKTEMFATYLNEFENSTEIKNLKRKKSFKDKTKEERELELNKRLIKYLYKIEKDKLLYFMLVSESNQKVLIVRSPSNNKEQKKFLGYEWSGAKGNEGIKYNGGNTVNDIVTPLFNPIDINDQSKLSFLIKECFLGEEPKIIDDFKDLVSYSNVADILGFGRRDFNKAFSMNPQRSVIIETKWDLAKLGDVVDVKIGGTPSRKESVYFGGDNLWVSIAEMNGQIITDTKEKITELGVQNSNVKLIKKGTTLLSFKLSIGKTAVAGADLYTNEAIAGLIPKDKNEILDKYLFQLFTSKRIDLEDSTVNVFGKSLNSTFLKEEVKIPLPTVDVQENIVEECEIIDIECDKALAIILKLQEEIKNCFKIVVSEKERVKIGSICVSQSGGTPSRKEKDYWNKGTINWLRSEVCQNSFVYEEQVREKITSLGLEKSSARLFKADTVLVALVGATIGRVAYLTFEASTNQNVAGLYPKDQNILNSKYLFYSLINDFDKNFGDRKGKFTMANMAMIRNLEIVLPNIKKQKEIVRDIEKLENKIKKAQAIIDEAPQKKQAIMDKYLK